MNWLLITWLVVNSIGFSIVVFWGLRETLADHRFAQNERLGAAVQYAMKAGIWQEVLTTAAFVVNISVGVLYFTPLSPVIGFALLLVSALLVIKTLLRRINRRQLLRRVTARRSRGAR